MLSKLKIILSLYGLDPFAWLQTLSALTVREGVGKTSSCIPICIFPDKSAGSGQGSQYTRSRAQDSLTASQDSGHSAYHLSPCGTAPHLQGADCLGSLPGSFGLHSASDIHKGAKTTEAKLTADLDKGCVDSLRQNALTSLNISCQVH